jgi:hypothetical protein
LNFLITLCITKKADQFPDSNPSVNPLSDVGTIGTGRTLTKVASIASLSFQQHLFFVQIRADKVPTSNFWIPCQMV